jgi:hypothetical protein
VVQREDILAVVGTAGAATIMVDIRLHTEVPLLGSMKKPEGASTRS